MNRMIMCGLALYAISIVIDRFIHALPSWTAILLFSGATVLILAGMLESRKSQKLNQ